MTHALIIGTFAAAITLAALDNAPSKSGPGGNGPTAASPSPNFVASAATRAADRKTPTDAAAVKRMIDSRLYLARWQSETAAFYAAGPSPIWQSIHAETNSRRTDWQTLADSIAARRDTRESRVSFGPIVNVIAAILALGGCVGVFARCSAGGLRIRRGQSSR